MSEAQPQYGLDVADIGDQDRDDEGGPSIATETLYGDLKRCILDEIKAMPNAWQQLSEREQSEVIDRVSRQMNEAASNAILAAHAGESTFCTGVVDQVTFKDGVKCVLKIPAKSDGRHELADREGRHVVVLMMEPEEYGAGEKPPLPDPDQRGLDLAEDQAQQATNPDANTGEGFGNQEETGRE